MSSRDHGERGCSPAVAGALASPCLLLSWQFIHMTNKIQKSSNVGRGQLCAAVQPVQVVPSDLGFLLN